MHIEEGALVGAVVGSISILPTQLVVGGAPFKAMAITIIDADDEPALTYQNYKFIQTEELTAAGIAVHPYGAIIFNAEVTLPLTSGGEKIIILEFDDQQFGASFADLIDAQVGEPVYFELIEDEGGGGGGGDV